MKILVLLISLALLPFLPVSAPLIGSFVSAAEAASRDALVLKCRKAVFRVYGQRKVEPDGHRVRVLRKDFVIQQVDRCVANGGRVR